MSENIDEKLKVKSEYGAEQVDSLEGLQAIRKRPGMYIGTTSQRGINQLVWEVADNSIDEYVAGFGKNIFVSVTKDGEVTVKDEGRGIPVGPHHRWKNEDGTPQDTLTGILTRMHAGGKFNGENSAYKSSGGLHGIGTKATNALSEYLIARVKRNGKIYEQKFERGTPVTEVEIVGECDANETGTAITYLPDKEIFKQTIMPDCKALQNRMNELASLNAGLHIYYSNEATGVNEEYYHEDGIAGYVNRMVGEKVSLYDDVLFFKGVHSIDENRDIIVEVAFKHDDDDKAGENIKSFANNINTHEGGFHYDGFRKAYRKFLNKYAEDKKLIKSPLSLQYLLEGINAVVSVKVPEAEFEGQTKTKLGNIEAEEAVMNIFEKGIEEFSKDHKSDEILQTIIEKSIRAKEADEAARKARQLVKQGKKAKKLALPGKLADCSSKVYSELFIVEGNSAGGCFTYDTKIKLADGRNLEIGKIVEEFEQGKVNYVYSSTEDGDIKVQPITNAFLTKKNAQIIELTLDNGEKIKCTPDHKFMLRDGSFKEAQHLSKEDSLMPLYYEIADNSFNENYLGDRYEHVLINKTGKYLSTHRLVANQYLGEKEVGYHTHHKDFNSLNNNPENLEYMLAEDHLKLHASNMTEETKSLISSSLKKYYEDNPEAKEHLSRKAKEQWANEGLRAWRSEETREQMVDPENRRKRRETMMQNRINRGLSLINSMINDGIEVNKKNYSELRKQQDRVKFIARWELLLQQLGDEREILKRASNYNHKVVKIEWLEEKADVYDITVPPYSNFALSAGVFVHNSAKAGRNRIYQAILSLRGKILNVEKSDISRMLNSDIIKNIIGAVGTGIDGLTGQKFEYDKLRYDKIILMTDADVDGEHIKALLLTLFYNYMRPLIEKGHIYVAQPPLYRAVKKNESVWLKNDYELKEYKKKYPNAEIQRFKGLTKSLALIPLSN